MNKFNQDQLDILRAEFAGIGAVNPQGPAYSEMLRLLGTFSGEQLKQIAGAKIKWLSYLSKRRLSDMERASRTLSLIA